MEKLKSFKILWNYLKKDKIKLFLYLFLVIITYIPALLSAFFWGLAVEYLINYEFIKFSIYLLAWSTLYILFFIPKLLISLIPVIFSVASLT